MLKKLTAMLSAALLMMTGCAEKDDSSVTLSKSAGSSAVSGDLTVSFIDVGKADCILLHTDESAVVIDCGEKGDGKLLLAAMEESGVTDVDALIITHYDKDHVGGAAKLINNVSIGEVYAPDYTEESEETEKYGKALDAKGISPNLLTSDVSFSLDGVDYTLYAPQKTFYGEDNDNDFSIVVKAVHGDNTLLFTGDAMEERLSEIMNIGQCTLLKVPYHGRKLDNLAAFLDAVSPKCAVTCTSAEEFANSTQKALSERGIASYATCYNGDITVVSNGSSLAVTTAR